jgi:hypothetical protein
MSLKESFKTVVSLFGLIIIITTLLLCKENKKPGEKKEFKEFFGEPSYFIGSTEDKFPKFHASGENIYIAYKSSNSKIEFVIFSFPKSISKYEVTEDGELKGVLPGKLIISRGNKVFLKDVSSGSEHELFESYGDAYYVLSSTEFAYFDGNSILISHGQNKSSIEAKAVVEEIKLLRVNDKIFTFYKTLIDGKKRILWTDGEKSGVLGKYKDREKLSFYPQGESFVAFLVKEVFGVRENIKLYAGGKEISNFSLGVTDSFIFVSLDDLPVGEIVAEYDVVPEFDQVEFDVSFDGANIFFIVVEQVYENLFGKTFYGKFDGENFRKLDVLETSLPTKVFLIAKNNFLVISFVQPHNSILLIFTTNKNEITILKNNQFYDVGAFPVLLDDLPYIFLLEKKAKDLFLTTYAPW